MSLPKIKTRDLIKGADFVKINNVNTNRKAR